MKIDLPKSLRSPADIIKRREAAATRKELWRSIYRETYEYFMPQRESFNFYSPGQRKDMHLFDSTGQECIYSAANTAQSLLCPSWKNWALLAPGGDISPEEAESQEVVDKLQETTETIFNYINHSNFSTVVPEIFLDLMVGTGAMTVEEGDHDEPLLHDCVPLSSLELEEGPNGSIKTEFQKHSITARNLIATFRGMTMESLPPKIQERIRKQPDSKIDVIRGCVYAPETKQYYGIAVDAEASGILWSHNYGLTSPYIVARASVTAGEIYGRGPAIWALPDMKTLNAMMEFMLSVGALQAAPPMTAVSDAVVNPYTMSLIPNTVIPVGSNDNGNPSLRVLDVGGNFNITEKMIDDQRMRIRRIMLGEMGHEGPVKSATEWMIHDRNRIREQGSVYGRIQSEFLSPYMTRVVSILQRMGKVPPIKIDGRQITLKYVSPLARAQDDEDLLALQKSLEILMPLGPEAIAASMKVERLGWWVARKTGLDADLGRNEDETKAMVEKAMQAQQPAPAPQPAGNVTQLRRA